MLKLVGSVVDVSDPRKLGRLRVAIPGRTQTIDKELLPWYEPTDKKYAHDLPPVGELIEVTLFDDDIYFGYWNRVTRGPKMLQLDDSDYDSAKVLWQHDMADYGGEGILQLFYRKSTGVRLSFQETEFLIRPDKTIALHNVEKGWWVDVSNESISFGTETKSAEPGVLGIQNHTALDMLNDTLKEMSDILDDGLKALSKRAMKSPYTSHLAVDFTKLAAKLKTTISNKMHSQNRDHFPKTKSKIVTLD